VLASEIGPQGLAEHELAVGDLPQKEVRDAVLTRGADDEVRVGHFGVVEVSGNGLLGDTAHPGVDEALHCIHQLSPAAVVEGDGEGQTSVAPGHLLGVVHQANKSPWYPPVTSADEPDAHVPLMHLVATVDEDLLVEPEQELNLVGRSSPVLGREGVHREPPDTQVVGALENVEQRLLTGGVALGTGQPPLLGPTAVTVHDACDVHGDRSGIQVGRKHLRNLPPPHPRSVAQPARRVLAMSTADEVSIALEEVTGALPGGGEVRGGQRSMALETAEAIDTEQHLVIQAGTGTGKTLAYLIPAILSGRRTVVATWSKALQDQMERSDLPVLVRHLDRSFSHAVLKGWDNYVCHERLDQIRETGGQRALDGVADGSDSTQVDSILEWSETSVSGDRADLPFEPTAAAWSSVSVGTDDCIGLSECPFASGCRPARARQRAREADICITNHHLYAVDVALNGMLLDHPDNPHELVIFDEAHQLEEVFTASFGFQLTAGRFRWLARLAKAALKPDEPAGGLDDAATRFSTWLADNPDRRLVADTYSDLDPVLDLAETRVDRVLVAARQAVRDISRGNDDPATQRERRRLTRLVNAGSTLIGDIRFTRELLRKPSEHSPAGRSVAADDHLTWVEHSGTRTVLRVAPIEVGPRLASDLWPLRTAVLTSATLPVNLPARLGLPDPATSTVDSPFDYETQSLLYCPTRIPNPSEDETGWSTAMLTELEYLIQASGGRTLALFTSWRRLQAAASAIRPLVPYPILEQGDLPARTLLEEFAADESSCLFATRSFWQGIDVPGPSLGLVVIDRIPFPRPDEHLTRAWRDRAGLDGWGAVDLPLGALRLAQGVGRLIRSRTDHGVAAVLDPRLSAARYSGALLAALPPMRRTSDPEEAVSFLESLFS